MCTFRELRLINLPKVTQEVLLQIVCIFKIQHHFFIILKPEAECVITLWVVSIKGHVISLGLTLGESESQAKSLVTRLPWSQLLCPDRRLCAEMNSCPLWG